MPISSLAVLPQDSQLPYSIYHTPHFQAFVVEVEATLEERLTEISAIAMSRASSNITDILCTTTLNALLNQSK